MLQRVSELERKSLPGGLKRPMLAGLEFALSGRWTAGTDGGVFTSCRGDKDGPLCERSRMRLAVERKRAVLVAQARCGGTAVLLPATRCECRKRRLPGQGM